jgi:RsiW-degrading membrane proteinase PrsW (M82 family)
MIYLAVLLQDQSSNPALGGGMLAAIIGFYLVFIVVAVVAIIIPFWFILKKAGMSPWLALINLVPFGTLILLYVLAFANWSVVPVQQAGWQPPYTPPIPPPPSSPTLPPQI